MTTKETLRDLREQKRTTMMGNSKHPNKSSGREDGPTMYGERDLCLEKIEISRGKTSLHNFSNMRLNSISYHCVTIR